MEKRSKAETLIGFCLKARKCKTGMNAVKTLRRANLIIVCNTASENTVKEARGLSEKWRAELYVTAVKPLAEYVHKDNVKVMAVTDKIFADGLAQGVTDGDFKRYGN